MPNSLGPRWRPLRPTKPSSDPSTPAVAVGNVEQNVNTVHVENQIQVPLVTRTQFPVWRVELWFPSDAQQAADDQSLIVSTVTPDPDAIAEARQRAGDAEQQLEALCLRAADQCYPVVAKAPGPLPPGTRLTQHSTQDNSAIYNTGAP